MWVPCVILLNYLSAKSISGPGTMILRVKLGLFLWWNCVFYNSLCLLSAAIQSMVESKLHKNQESGLNLNAWFKCLLLQTPPLPSAENNSHILKHYGQCFLCRIEISPWRGCDCSAFGIHSSLKMSCEFPFCSHTPGNVWSLLGSVAVFQHGTFSSTKCT